MFANLQLRPAKPHRRKPSLAQRAGVAKRRVSYVSPGVISNVPSLSFMEGLFGNEFPESFGHTRNRKSLADLPAEILAIISNHISKLDIKKLRLTSKHLAANVDLRVDRVYISPNQINLERLQWILDRPKYRTQVEEIVWDDAQLEEYCSLQEFALAIHNDEEMMFAIFERRQDHFVDHLEYASQHDQSLDREDYFDTDGHLTHAAKEILMQQDDFFARNMLLRNAALMSIEESYTLYQRLYAEEQDLIRGGMDVVAFRHTLAELPALKRITLTSQVWQPWGLPSRYDSPFQRSLPSGFRKPSVWPWLSQRPHPRPSSTGGAMYSEPPYLSYRDKSLVSEASDPDSHDFRGYGIVLSSMATIPKPIIQEFVIDAGRTDAGIDPSFHVKSKHDRDHIIHVLQRHPLQRLHLSFHHAGSRFATDSLAGLHQLKHLDLNMNMISRQTQCDTTHARFFSIASNLPPSLISRLETLALRNAIVAQRDLLHLLLEMRKAQHITADNVVLAAGSPETLPEPSWASLFRALRFAQNHDFTTSRPRFTWLQPMYNNAFVNVRHRCIDDEISAFLYSGGENPFAEYAHQSKSTGWVVWEQESGRRVRATEAYHEDEAVMACSVDYDRMEVARGSPGR
ncbi:hypothetical protein ACN47E_009851 [Coniothyrium glycines]